MGVTGAHLGPSKLLGGCTGVCCCSLPAPLQFSSPAADLASELLHALLCFPELGLHPAANQTPCCTLPHISLSLTKLCRRCLKVRIYLLLCFVIVIHNSMHSHANSFLICRVLMLICGDEAVVEQTMPHLQCSCVLLAGLQLLLTYGKLALHSSHLALQAHSASSAALRIPV